MTEIPQEIVAAAIGAVVAFIGSYLLLRWQLDEARKLAKAQLLIEFDNRLTLYDKVHSALRPNGSWKTEDEDTPADIEWYEVDGYMGAFERLEQFIVDNIIDENAAREFYGYRLSNLVNNQSIRRNKLINEQLSWCRFLRLCQRLRVETDIDGC